GLLRELDVNTLGVDLHFGWLLDQIADVAQEFLIGFLILDRARVVAVPGVDLVLQALALGEQFAVPGCALVDECIKAGPELVGIDAASGQCLVVDEVEEISGHLQSMAGRAFSHGVFLSERLIVERSVPARGSAKVKGSQAAAGDFCVLCSLNAGNTNGANDVAVG